MSRDLPASAEVVVVGGGAVGAATTFYLTELGLHDVVLIERETLSSGSTGKSAGGFRLQFADELNIRIALRALPVFESFSERFETDIGLVQAGYLFLLSSKKDLALFREALELQASLGVPSRELTVEEATALVPPLESDGLIGATFCPKDGHVTPESVVLGFTTAAARQGATIVQGTAVKEVALRGTTVEAVVTERGKVATHTVVCAAGLWSKALAATAGVELPIAQEAHWMHYTPLADPFPDLCPLTIDFETGFYFHREGPGLAFGGREQSLEELAAVATPRVPVLANAPVQSSWWGYYAVSPDHNAIVGESAEASRFLYATGFSGHGFQQSPVVGEYLAELVVRNTPTMDLSPFSLERFQLNAPKAERFVV